MVTSSHTVLEAGVAVVGGISNGLFAPGNKNDKSCFGTLPRLHRLFSDALPGNQVVCAYEVCDAVMASVFQLLHTKRVLRPQGSCTDNRMMSLIVDVTFLAVRLHATAAL